MNVKTMCFFLRFIFQIIMFSHAMYFVIITYMSVVVLLLLCLLFAFILMLKINVTLYKL